MINSNLICQKTFRNNNNPPSLPSYYTKVKPIKSTPSTLRISTINSMKSMAVDHFDESKNWFNYIHHHYVMKKCYTGAIVPSFVSDKCRTLAVNAR